MAALLHPETHSLFSLDLEPALDTESAREFDAPWNRPGFLTEVTASRPVAARGTATGTATSPAGPAAPGLRLISGGLDPKSSSSASSSPTPACRVAPIAPIAQDAVTVVPAVSVTGRMLRTVVAGLALAGLLAFAAVGVLTLLGADAAATVPASPAVVNHPIGVDATTTSSTPVEVVVQSGDTLWTIARRLHPTGEIRGLVDALAERAGSSALDAGQRIDISGLLGR